MVSGIIGFAYSSLTAAYTGNNPVDDNPETNNIHYENWIVNAIDEKKIDSLFSVAIERGANGGGGQVALGGLPTIDFDHDFSSTPLEIHSFTPRHPLEASNFTYVVSMDRILLPQRYLTHLLMGRLDVHRYYTIQPDGWVIGEESISTNFRVSIVMKQIHS